jgi:8-oxo-dGTP diphosphatase
MNDRADGGESERAPDDRPRGPALTVDGVILLRRPSLERPPLSVLLVQRGREPFRGAWALPGGFVEYGEDPDLAVRREVVEETGLDDLPFRHFGVYGDPDRDPRGHTVTIVYVAEIVGDAPLVLGGDDAARAAWFPLDQLPELAFDHGRIIGDLRKRLRLR